MQADEMLVLACSKKWEGRCVAGISKRTRGWLRPVSRRIHRELGSYHYRINGRDIEPLDVVQIEYGDNLNDPSQPENVEVGASRWRLTGRVDAADAGPVLARHIIEGPALLGNHGAALLEEEATRGVEASLALVRPTWAEFSLEPTHPGKDRTRPRASFEFDGEEYDLALTDYLVAPRLVAAGIGAHGLADLGLPSNSDVFLTVSLAEPQDGWCTKLVAAVMLPGKS
jgi:Dual OB-containing domain